jgi:hypothetical protein
MAQLTQEEIKIANRERLDHASEAKAKLWAAEKAVAEEGAWYWFCKNHCGSAAIKRGDTYFACEANNGILLSVIASMDPPQVNLANLEVAFARSRDRLANPPPEPYERKADCKVSTFVAQASSETQMPPAPFRLNYTKQQILDMSADKQRKIMAKGKPYVDELNRILNSEE